MAIHGTKERDVRCKSCGTWFPWNHEETCRGDKPRKCPRCANSKTATELDTAFRLSKGTV